jgi:predicted phosphodiesterase
MIVTIFGDVHGNLIALEQLFKIENSRTDLFVCHGDVVNYGPWSDECVAFLKEVSNIKLLQGNHEEYFISGKYPGENIVAKSFFEFCYPKFSKDLISEISTYQDQFKITDFAIQHTIGNKYIFQDTDLTDMVLDSNYIIGHSHQQYFREKDNFKLYNTGSLGQNRKYLNQSCYLQLDTDTNKIELKSFIHDIDKLIVEMKHRSYPKICLDYYNSKEKI